MDGFFIFLGIFLGIGIATYFHVLLLSADSKEGIKRFYILMFLLMIASCIFGCLALAGHYEGWWIAHK